MEFLTNRKDEQVTEKIGTWISALISSGKLCNEMRFARCWLLWILGILRKLWEMCLFILISKITEWKSHALGPFQQNGTKPRDANTELSTWNILLHNRSLLPCSIIKDVVLATKFTWHEFLKIGCDKLLNKVYSIRSECFFIFGKWNVLRCEKCRYQCLEVQMVIFRCFFKPCCWGERWTHTSIWDREETSM